MQSDMKNILAELASSIESASKVPGIGNKAMVDIKKLKSILKKLVYKNCLRSIFVIFYGYFFI